MDAQVEQPEQIPPSSEDVYLSSLLGGKPFERVLESDNDDPEHQAPDVVRIKHGLFIEQGLPPGFFLKGGAARAIAQRMIGDEVMSPRDIDIAAITDFKPNLELMSRLEEKYMPEDRKAASYMPDVKSLTDYFTSRDFVLNEVLVDGEYLYATPGALVDLKEKVIRPTEFHRNTLLPGRLVVKAVRFLAEFEEMYGKGAISQIEDWRFCADHIPVFHIALSIDRARQRGDRFAETFYQKLIEFGIVGEQSSGDLPAGRSYSELAVNVNEHLARMFGDPFPFSFDTETGEMNDPYLDLAEQYYPEEYGPSS